MKRKMKMIMKANVAILIIMATEIMKIMKIIW
jgi:hypothetical protein